MTIKSQKFIENLLKGNELIFSRVYSSFLLIPAQILNSNEKIILLFLQCVADGRGFFTEQQLLDFNNEAIAMLTGIPIGTVNRILSNLQNKAAAANKWLIDNNFEERISLTKFKNFSSATIYNYSHTEPRITRSVSVEHKQEQPRQRSADIPARKNNEFYIDTELKQKALIKTGFAVEDLEEFLKYDIQRINRNVQYFTDKYLNKGAEVNLNLFRKTLSHDYGKIYLSDKQKAIEFLQLVNKAIEIINNNLTDNIREKIKAAYKFDPPADISIFNTKSDVIKHVDFKLNQLGTNMQKSIRTAADAYYQFIKYEAPFHSKNEASRQEIALIAAMQIVHNVINFHQVINFKEAA